MIAVMMAGRSISQVLDAAQMPDSVRQFVETTFSIIRQGQHHTVAVALYLRARRPNIGHVSAVGGRAAQPVSRPARNIYLSSRRYIQLDEDVHAPLAQQMVRELCADDPDRWLECQ